MKNVLFILCALGLLVALLGLKEALSQEAFVYQPDDDIPWEHERPDTTYQIVYVYRPIVAVEETIPMSIPRNPKTSLESSDGELDPMSWSSREICEFYGDTLHLVQADYGYIDQQARIAGIPPTKWMAVSLPESRTDPKAKNTKNRNGSVDRGTWQINSVHKSVILDFIQKRGYVGSYPSILFNMRFNCDFGLHYLYFNRGLQPWYSSRYVTNEKGQEVGWQKKYDDFKTYKQTMKNNERTAALYESGGSFLWYNIIKLLKLNLY